MKKFLFVFSLLLCSVVTVMAQRHITGTVIDKDTEDGVMQATVSLLKSDSTFVKGVISDVEGKFSVTAPSNGTYLLKISSVAYKTLVRRVTVADGKNVVLGDVPLSPDAIMLKEAVVSGQAAKVVVKEDTFVYNAAAYHTPEGSVLEELVKRLPGAQIDDDGKIKINGKEVKKILVDGKEFMTGDTETAMKNIPTSIVDRIKAYDQKSDLARVTGIDDGEEETVLDFGIKRGMNRGIMVNGDLAYGTKDRYSERMMGAYMKDNLKIMGFGQANNTGDRGFPGGGGGPQFGGGGNGLNSSKMLALNINYEKKDKLTLDGSVRWNHRDGDVWSRKATESFTGKDQAFSNSLSQSFSRADSWNAQMRLEWKPDTMTNIMFRPQLSLSTDDKTGVEKTRSFNTDPYDLVADPLSDEQKELDKLTEGAMLNRKTTSSLSYSESNSASAMLQYNRKLNNKGRNITLRARVNFSDGESTSASLQDVHLYQYDEALVYQLLNDSVYQKNRYNLTPTKKFDLNTRLTYSEPLAKTLFLQLSYQFRYSKSKSDRATYDFSDNLFPTTMFHQYGYRNWDSMLSSLSGYPVMDPYYNEALSKNTEYDTYTHVAELQLRKVGQKWNYNVGIMFQPQNSTLKYKYQMLDTIVKRSVFNIAPTLDLRYKISKVSQLRATYRAQTNQPSMTDMMDIRDDSDPMHIKSGNPSLKPEFNHNFRLFYNGYSQFHTQSWMVHTNYSMTQNSVTSVLRYNPTTGGDETRPENINGNWNVNVGGMYNASIDSAGVWNIHTYTGMNYTNRVSYLMQDTETLRNKTNSTNFSERLGFSYRSSWLEVEPNGNVNYTKSRNQLNPKTNLNTWTYNYGMNVTINAPWGTSLSTDAHMNSRRGYSDSNMNTNEFVWNAQVAQSFLKGRPLTVSLQFYDILHNQTTISRAITAMSRVDSEFNAINSYAMLHVIYRFNSFGGKGAKSGNGGAPDFNDPRLRSRGGMPGPPPGGFGGGRRF